MHKVFSVFDRDHDGSITIQDVEEVMNSLQFLHNELEMPSLEQIRVAFDKFDENSKNDFASLPLSINYLTKFFSSPRKRFN
jgi:Ca2+-binding EF-hand superfamily protein